MRWTACLKNRTVKIASRHIVSYTELVVCPDCTHTTNAHSSLGMRPVGIDILSVLVLYTDHVDWWHALKTRNMEISIQDQFAIWGKLLPLTGEKFQSSLKKVTTVQKSVYPLFKKACTWGYLFFVYITYQ